MHALHAASDGAGVLSTDARQRGRQPDGFGSDPRPQIGAKIAHRPQTARCRIRSEAQMDPTASDAGLPIAGYAASWLAAHDRARPACSAAAAVLFAGATAALVTFAGNSLLGAGMVHRRNAAPNRPVVLAPVRSSGSVPKRCSPGCGDRTTVCRAAGSAYWIRPTGALLRPSRPAAFPPGSRRWCRRPRRRPADAG